MNKNKHLIWSNNNLDFDDWKDDLREDYPDRSDSELIELMYAINNDYLGDERMNLDIQLNSPILVIADLGLWNGRRSGYKEIKSGNIKDCLYSDCEYSEWYVDELGDLWCEDIHHDGRNYLLYRVYKDSATESQIENLKSKIYEGTATRRDITNVTKRLGDVIANVYGWKIRGMRT